MHRSPSSIYTSALACLLAIGCASLPSPSQAPARGQASVAADAKVGAALSRSQSQEDLSNYFGAFQGTLVLLDVERDHVVRFNPSRAAQRFSPCSTFKIPNALIGLETGVLSGPDHAMTWDGTRYPIEAWNQDQTLRTAIPRSVVWYFQRVAEGVGEERMRRFLHAIPYGNEDISGGITRFWLDGGGLRISADEQVEIMRRLAAGDLPFSRATLDTVRELIRVDETERGVLRGKTGSARASGERPPFGWFVGYVEHAGRVVAFALNIEGENASGAVARDIAVRLLRDKQWL